MCLGIFLGGFVFLPPFCFPFLYFAYLLPSFTIYCAPYPGVCWEPGFRQRVRFPKPNEKGKSRNFLKKEKRAKKSTAFPSFTGSEQTGDVATELQDCATPPSFPQPELLCHNYPNFIRFSVTNNDLYFVPLCPSNVTFLSLFQQVLQAYSSVLEPIPLLQLTFQKFIICLVYKTTSSYINLNDKPKHLIPMKIQT